MSSSASSLSSSSSLQGTFRFVLIPADDSQPIQELSADKAGGLSDDALIAHARKHFSSSHSSNTNVDNLSPEEKAELVAQIRQQLSADSSISTSTNTSQLQALSDDALLDMFHNNSNLNNSNSCEISAVTVPTERNRYTAVSLYYSMMTTPSSSSSSQHSVINKRAIQILVACGHSASQIIYGDAFCGRAIDDEFRDVWERVDFSAHEASPAAEWCKIAATPGGGGGSGSSSSSSPSGSSSNAASLSNLIMGAGGGAPAAAVVGPGGSSATTSTGADALFGTNGVAVTEAWGSWTQYREEMELKFALVDATVTSKQVQVQFSRAFVKVIVSGQVLLEGKPFDDTQVDDCTYTLQTTREGIRELCVTLAKAQEGRTWSWAVR